MSWRTGGIGPEKTSAGLRGIGLIAIVIAFLAVSNGYVSGGGDDQQDRSTPSGRAVVVAPESARGVLTAVTPQATYRFASTADVRRAVEDNDRADVVFTDRAADADALAGGRRCTRAVLVATKGRRPLLACLPTSVDADAALGRRYLAALTTLRARAAFLDAGYDLP